MILNTLIKAAEYLSKKQTNGKLEWFEFNTDACLGHLLKQLLSQKMTLDVLNLLKYDPRLSHYTAVAGL